MGSKSSPSAFVCSHSPDAVPIDSSVHQVLFKCGPPRLRWTTSSSATTTRIHDMAWLAGRPGGILIIWPAIRSRLSATMSCNLRCPVHLTARCTKITVVLAMQVVVLEVLAATSLASVILEDISPSLWPWSWPWFSRWPWWSSPWLHRCQKFTSA